LCYVGMTRAMKKLTMSFAIKRFLHWNSKLA
jgi:DNA helicase-2/ATP-dependent DNA helicase PcrA